MLPAPAPKPLAEIFGTDREEVAVYLAIPQYRERGLNISPPMRDSDTRYRAEVETFKDENTGLSERPVQVRAGSFNAMKIFLNGKPTTALALREAVQASVAKDPKTQAIISGDKSVSHGRVVWVLDVVKSLGVASFAIQIDPTAMTAPGSP